MELRYFRDVDKREVGFVILEDSLPIYFVECRHKGTRVSQGLRYLKKKFPEVPAAQVVYEIENDFLNKEGIRI